MKKLTVVALVVVVLGLLAGNVAAQQVPTAVILSFSPDSTLAGGPSFTLTVNGANFRAGALVRVNGTSRSTTFVSSSQLLAVIPFSDITSPTTLQITVLNQGAPSSSALLFQVLPSTPVISTLDPNTLDLNTNLLAIKITGQNFGTSAVARVNGVNRATSFVSNTELTLNLSSSDVAHTGTLNITVLNPNNKVSNVATISVVTPSTVPKITVLNPSSVVFASNAFTLSVVGTTFVSGAVVKVNGSARTTTFVDATHLNASITANDVLKTGSLSITVTNPNGSTSAPATLTVTAGTLPTIQTISPTSVTVDTAGFTLTINGTNFTAGTTVKVGNTTPRNATFVTSGQVTVPIFGSDIINVGQVPISVTTPGTTGGTSNQINLFVVAQTAPQITALSPSLVPTGPQPVKVVISGLKFLLDDIVLVNGVPHTTEFVSASQLVVTIPAAELASPAVLAISVTRKDGTATSAPVNFTITNAEAPAITAFSPVSSPTGTAAQPIVIIGRNFTSTSVATFDNVPRDTQFISSTELHVTLTAADVAVPHDFAVVIVDGSGASSTPVTYSVIAPVPTIASIQPATVISGEQAFQLKVLGTNFSSLSVVNINGVPQSTQIQTSTGALTVSVPASAISAAGTLNVTVTDNGITSAPVPLTVLGPSITSLTPTAVEIGATSVQLTVQGSAFLPTSKIVFKGADQITQFNASDGSLTTTISGADLLTPGIYAVNVRNSPDSVSAPFILTVSSPGAPLVTSIDPGALSVGANVASIRVLGTNFVPLSVVTINGSDRTTTFIGGNEIDAALLPGDLSHTGDLHISVRNPDGTSAPDFVVTVSAAAFNPPRRRAVGH